MTCTCRSIACGTASRSTPSGAVRTVAAACTKRASGGSVSSAILQVPGASTSPAPVGTYSAMSPSPTSGSATTSLANRTASQLSSSNALSCTTRPSGASTRVMPRPNPSSSRAAVNSSETAPSPTSTSIARRRARAFRDRARFARGSACRGDLRRARRLRPACARVARLRRVRRVDRSAVGRSVAADEERSASARANGRAGPGTIGEARDGTRDAAPDRARDRRGS